MTQKEILALQLENAKLYMEILNLRVELANAHAPRIRDTITQITEELNALDKEEKQE